MLFCLRNYFQVQVQVSIWQYITFSTVVQHEWRRGCLFLVETSDQKMIFVFPNLYGISCYIWSSKDSNDYACKVNPFLYEKWNMSIIHYSQIRVLLTWLCNSLFHCGLVIPPHRSLLMFAQVMACFMIAPNYYLNQSLEQVHWNCQIHPTLKCAGDLLISNCYHIPNEPMSW